MRISIRLAVAQVFVLLLSIEAATASPACSSGNSYPIEKPPLSLLSNDLLFPGQLEPVLAALVEQLYPDLEYIAPPPVQETWGANLSELFLPKPLLLRFRSTESRFPDVEVLVSDSYKPNAIALPPDEDSNQPAQIILSRGLLSYLGDRAELGFVLAHEMSHIREDHFPLLPPFLLTASQLKHISDVHKSWELQADRQALTLLQARHMNLDAPVRVLHRLEAAEEKEKEAASDAIESHPKMSERIAALTNKRTGS